MLCHTYPTMAKSHKTHPKKREKIMPNKNAYELRAEVLEMAKSYMDKQLELNMEYAKKAQELGHIQMEQFKSACQPYSVEELMEKAREFYSFVEKKNDKA